MAQITPDPIMRIAMGFMAAKHLFVANEIGLFTGLGRRSSASSAPRNSRFSRPESKPSPQRRQRHWQPNYDFSRHRRLLDIGGGTGSFLLAVLRRHAALRGTLYGACALRRAQSRPVAQATCPGSVGHAPAACRSVDGSGPYTASGGAPHVRRVLDHLGRGSDL